MTVLAITGGFGTGKTTVAGMFSKQGALVLDVDALVRELEEPKGKAWKKITDSFGKKILLSDNSLNRKELGRLVFSDETQLRRLNALVHPLVLEETKKRVNQLKKKHPCLVVDIPLLFEVGEEGFFDFIVVVTAEEKQVIQRLSQKRDLSPKEIRQRIQSQIPLEKKASRAHFVIDNNNGLPKTRQQVLHVYQAVFGNRSKPF